MAKFRVNSGFSSERVVEAEYFQTVGQFVDFVDRDGTVFRIQASDVATIERVKE